MAEVIVFAGPSLPEAPDAGWQSLLAQVEVRPPAQRGDVLVAAAARPHTIVLIDGYYYTVPAVTHKELLYALDAGIRVIGAASMGALRAAELASFGMESVGEVADWYRAGLIDGDDEVAILHAPDGWGYRSATVALVDVRWALAALARAGVVRVAAAAALVAEVKALPFTRRTDDVVDVCARDLLGEAGASALRERLAGGSVKRDDARAAIEAALVARPARRPLPLPGDTLPSTTNFLSHYREWYLHLGATDRERARRRTIMKAWYMVQLLHPDAPRLVRALRRRFLLASAATHAGVTAARGAMRRTVQALEAHLAATDGAPAMPALELHAEARDHLLAEAAVARWGSARAALAALAARYGLEGARAEHTLQHLASLQDDSIPPWALARASVFAPTLVQAGRVAEAAGEVFAAFRRWSGPSRIRDDDLRAVAAQLWGCRVEDTDAEARRRGLLRSHVTHGFVAGHLGAVELLAAAERLAEPVNEYQAARDALRAMRAGHVLGIPGDARYARPRRPTYNAR